MTLMAQHEAAILDVEAIGYGVETCALWHEDTDDGERMGTARITLDTATGAREVVVCDDHLYVAPGELVVWSSALDPIQQELEGAIFEASLAARIRR